MLPLVLVLGPSWVSVSRPWTPLFVFTKRCHPRLSHQGNPLEKTGSPRWPSHVSKRLRAPACKCRPPAPSGLLGAEWLTDGSPPDDPLTAFQPLFASHDGLGGCKTTLGGKIHSPSCLGCFESAKLRRSRRLHLQNHRHTALGPEALPKLGKLGRREGWGWGGPSSKQTTHHGLARNVGAFLLPDCPDLLRGEGAAAGGGGAPGACFIDRSCPLSLIALSQRTSHQTAPAIAASSCQPPPSPASLPAQPTAPVDCCSPCSSLPQRSQVQADLPRRPPWGKYTILPTTTQSLPQVASYQVLYCTVHLCIISR